MPFEFDDIRTGDRFHFKSGGRSADGEVVFRLPDEIIVKSELHPAHMTWSRAWVSELMKKGAFMHLGSLEEMMKREEERLLKKEQDEAERKLREAEEQKLKEIAEHKRKLEEAEAAYQKLITHNPFKLIDV